MRPQTNGPWRKPVRRDREARRDERLARAARDSGELMTALGETGPTTDENFPRRLALVQASGTEIDGWEPLNV